jgi:hypothetical protein
MNVNYQEWLKTVPASLTEDSLWNVEAYRLALFTADVAWHDVTKLCQDKRTLGLASQLYDAIGSTGANLSEGYSRGSRRDRARFYEYTLGSARESRTWYFDGRYILGERSPTTAFGSSPRSSDCSSRWCPINAVKPSTKTQQLMPPHPSTTHQTGPDC